MDVSMLTLFNSQERDRDDWVGLFKRTNAVTSKNGHPLLIIRINIY